MSNSTFSNLSENEEIQIVFVIIGRSLFDNCVGVQERKKKDVVMSSKTKFDLLDNWLQ